MSSADSYDELGRLRTKKRHGGADTETYAYNIRNWTTQINSGSFTEKLYYNTNPLNARPCYNGNISYSTWTYNNGSTTAEKGYAYEYDELNRLVNAEYQQGSSSQATGSFNEQFTYDKMGNILTLQRKKDNALIDNLTFNYKNNNGSNQLNYITDAAGTRGLSTIKEYQGLSAATAGEFQYDANGNLIKDADREIVRIKYNLLNLPDTVVFANGNLIINRYDASGRKLLSRYLTKVEEALLPVLIPKKNLEKPSEIIGEDFKTIDEDLGVPDKIITLDIKTFEGYETNYAENFEYESTVNIYTDRTETTTQTLTRLHTPEGYITTVSSPQYHYYRRDHLGNNREVWLANTNTTLQRTQYYPSGLPWAEGLGAGVQNKKYNGKEFVEMHGLDEYDSEARWYQPAIMRTTTQDPHSENYYDSSPYAWCGNNFVNNFDPDGMDWQTSSFMTTGSFSTVSIDYYKYTQNLASTFIGPNNEFIEHRDDGDSGVYLVENVEEWRKNGSKKEKARHVGYEWSSIVDYSKLKPGDNVTYGRLPASGRLEIDNTFEMMFIPTFGWLKMFNWAKYLKYLKFGKLAAKTSTKLYSEATYKAFERQLAKDGMKSILKTQSRIQKNLAEHIQKLGDIKKAGGYSSSVEREIKTFQSQLDAIKDLLK